MLRALLHLALPFAVTALASCSFGPPSALSALPGHSARFDVSGLEGAAPFAVRFVVQDGSAEAQYEWDFGDGGSGAGALAEHVYTRAGVFIVRLDVLDPEDGQPLTSVTQRIAVHPGPVAAARLVHVQDTVFTGDALSLDLEAFDSFGNPVPVQEAVWEATSGEVIGSPDGALFTAGREAGAARVTAFAGDGARTVVAETTVVIEPGYCLTERRYAEWDVAWLPARGGQPLARSSLPAAFSIGGLPPAAAGASRLNATALIVVQRQGPVRFAASANARTTLRVNGTKVLDFMGGETVVQLEPGLHRLELEHTWDAAPQLRFEADGDVLEWDAVTECHGGFATPPDGRYTVWETLETASTIADRFGTVPASLVHGETPAGPAVLVPGIPTPETKVILLHGLGSRATCAPEDRTHVRGRTMTHAVQMHAWETTGLASALDAADFITFSYGGTYADCATGVANAGEATPPAGARAVYASVDTCAGVAAAAERLGSLVDGLLAESPDARVYLIGHSLGGMVGAYYLATGKGPGVESVQALVTLDSPLQGYRGIEVRLPCAVDSPSRRDLRGDSPVVAAIRELGGTPWADKLLAINSTFIGAAVGPRVVTLECHTVRVQRDNWLTILFGDLLDAVSEWAEGHDCGFTHADSLAAIAGIINGHGPPVGSGL